MKWQEQKLTDTPRYTVVPRTLVFIIHHNELLLLRGAPDKRLWANKLNGIGGHIEPDEQPLSGARREVREETGLELSDLQLRAIVHIAGRDRHAGVMIFAYTAFADHREVMPSREGALEWHPLDKLPYQEMVADLPHLLPRVLHNPESATTEPIVYGLYASDEHDDLSFQFDLA